VSQFTLSPQKDEEFACLTACAVQEITEAIRLKKESVDEETKTFPPVKRVIALGSAVLEQANALYDSIRDGFGPEVTNRLEGSAVVEPKDTFSEISREDFCTSVAAITLLITVPDYVLSDRDESCNFYPPGCDAEDIYANWALTDLRDVQEERRVIAKDNPAALHIDRLSGVLKFVQR